MLDTKRLKAPLSLNADVEGAVQAAFSVFDTIDSDGDVVLASAFTPGQAVPMVWAHDWTKPVGKGAVRVEPERAVFDGAFFLDTAAGLDAYRTVKHMADLQEWSWGFRVLESETGSFGGEKVRFIKRAELFEVSPVLVGSNRQTETLAIKGHDLEFDDHSEAVRVASAEWLARVRSGCEQRRKEGRPISEARRQRLAAMRDAMRQGADELDAMLAETEPKPKQTAAGDPLAALRFAHARRMARLSREFGVSA